MSDLSPGLSGLWLPLITPFRDGDVDDVSLQRLLNHYTAQPIDGLILCATTGEGLTLDEEEAEHIVSISAREAARSGKTLPVYLGLSGSDTRKLADMLTRMASWPIDGYLISCPYYSRPSQAGLIEHFSAAADATERPILIYNIPYRTGVNLKNDAMLELAERPNIVGVKDCCADMAQSFDLLQRRPSGFSVLTGEDAQFYNALAQGSDGAILAAAHVMTQGFADIRALLADGDQTRALAAWKHLAGVPAVLFREPSPAPIKHWLWRSGLIDSPELRLPMVPVSEDLARAIEQEMAKRLPPP